MTRKHEHEGTGHKGTGFRYAYLRYEAAERLDQISLRDAQSTEIDCIQSLSGLSLASHQYFSMARVDVSDFSMLQIPGSFLFILCFMVNFICLISFNTQCHISLFHLSYLLLGNIVYSNEIFIHSHECELTMK